MAVPREVPAVNAFRLIALAACLSLPAPARADSPLPPPKPHTACSPSGAYCAVSEPAANITHVLRAKTTTPLYSIRGWHRWLFVADDGESVVTGHDGLNLVPAGATLREPVLVFHRRGKPVRTLVLGDLYADRAQLQRTVSHLAWTNGVRLEGDALVVERVDGKLLRFDVRTGLPRAEMPARPRPLDAARPR
jgi:hypothetical protein